MLNNIKSKNKLKILELNVNSIISLDRRHQLNIFINEHNPDIFFLNETHLRSKHKINIRNYTFIRNQNNDEKYSGTAILAKNNLNIEIITLNQNFINLEHVIIKVALTNNKYVYCICIYINPIKPFHTPDLTALFHFLDLKNNLFVIGGDFNCRHPLLNDSTTNSFGTKFVRWLQRNNAAFNITMLNSSQPTYKNTSYLDLFLINSNLFNFPIQNQIIHTYPTFLIIMQ